MLVATIERLWDGAAARPDERVRVEATRAAGDLHVTVDAPFHGDAAPAHAPGRCPGLWHHEVVELFLVDPDGRYLELEFGPHGHYLALLFEGRRQLVTDVIDLGYEAARDDRRWRGRAVIPGKWLPDPVERWNAFAIHGDEAQRRYLATWPLPGAAPDFHRVDAYPRSR